MKINLSQLTILLFVTHQRLIDDGSELAAKVTKHFTHGISMAIGLTPRISIIITAASKISFVLMVYGTSITYRY